MMHWFSSLSLLQVIWVLSFASMLTLLVVLLGRDRVRRFPWFTAVTALAALNLVVSKLLFGRLPQLEFQGVMIVLADLAGLGTLLLLLELARNVFGGVNRRVWAGWTLILTLTGCGVLTVWGEWPAWKVLTAPGLLPRLGDLQLLAVKLGLLDDVLAVGLGVLVAVFGGRFGARWRGHGQRLALGLAVSSAAKMGAEGLWQSIAMSAKPQTMEEYQHIMGMQEKLFNASNGIYIAVLLWWIAALWLNEPRNAVQAEAVAAEPAAEPATEKPGGDQTAQ